MSVERALSNVRQSSDGLYNVYDFVKVICKFRRVCDAMNLITSLKRDYRSGNVLGVMLRDVRKHVFTPRGKEILVLPLEDLLVLLDLLPEIYTREVREGTLA